MYTKKNGGSITILHMKLHNVSENTIIKVEILQKFVITYMILRCTFFNIFYSVLSVFFSIITVEFQITILYCP